TYLAVGPDGLIDLDALRDAITDRTVLVSVMAVNNEIGVIARLREIGALCRERGVLFHTDAAQAAGKIPLDVAAMNIDLMSISGHKIYGPKGVGAIYIRRRPRVRLVPLLSGGGQEEGIRSGTLAPAQCVGIGDACRLAGLEMADDFERIQGLYRAFLDGLFSRLDGIRLNGHEQERFPGNINLSFNGVDGDLLIAGMRDLAVSSGAACASAVKEPSYVLAALGLSKAEASASIRFGFGRFTTEAEISHAVATVAGHVERLRAEDNKI
ncbi:MAG: aminotransferase class V-fold PLP-dependent enzyme, partial [Sphingomonadales bacterium]